jgi:hypothetical protein
MELDPWTWSEQEVVSTVPVVSGKPKGTGKKVVAFSPADPAMVQKAKRLAQLRKKQARQQREAEARKAAVVAKSAKGSDENLIASLRKEIGTLKEASQLQTDKLARRVAQTAAARLEMASAEADKERLAVDVQFLRVRSAANESEVKRLEGALEASETKVRSLTGDLSRSQVASVEFEKLLEDQREANRQAEVAVAATKALVAQLEAQLQVEVDALSRVRAEQWVAIGPGQGAKAETTSCMSELLWEQVHHLDRSLANPVRRRTFNEQVQRFREQVVGDVRVWRLGWERPDPAMSSQGRASRGAGGDDIDPEPHRLTASMAAWKERLDRLWVLLLNVARATDSAGRPSVEAMRGAPRRSEARITMVGRHVPAAAAGSETQVASDATAVPVDSSGNQATTSVVAEIPQALTTSLVGTTEAMRMVVSEQTSLRERMDTQSAQLAEILAQLRGQTGLESAMKNLGKDGET